MKTTKTRRLLALLTIAALLVAAPVAAQSGEGMEGDQMDGMDDGMMDGESEDSPAGLWLALVALAGVALRLRR